MAVTVKHPFVSTVPDSSDTSLVRPSNWNADHTITGLGTAAELNAGVANGVATLDGSGTVPISQLPSAVLGALSYQGTWNASTNTPTLTSGTGTKGYYYVVNVAGSTNLDGITDWKVGDWAVFNGTTWQKIDNTDAVTSVNGYTGTVVLTQPDISGTVPTSRTISTGTGLTGGGDLSANRTISFSTAAVGTWAATPSSANLAAAMTDETGSGSLVFGTGPTLSAPVIDGANPYIQFNNGSAVTVAAGKLWYDGSTGSWNAGMGGGNITQQIGEELYVYGKASSAITDSPLQIVYKTGTVGASGNITFAPTVAGITNDDVIIGVATENIALNATGRITCFGVVHNITTNGAAYGETWSDGDTIWYNPVTGNPTKTKPTAPNVKCQIGTVINAGAGGSGSFQVEIIHGTALGGTDSNVNITSATNGNILTYDGTNSYWKNTDLTAGTGISVSKSATGVLTVTNSSPNTYDPTNVAITGGTINGTTIGATTPATGKFTTLESTGTGSFGTTNAQYIQAVGNATEPQILAAGSGTNIPLVLQPKGTGALQAQATDSTVTGGNARGTNAVDWQTKRGLATQVASATYSTIGGGANNLVTSTQGVVAGGANNTASGGTYAAILGGNNNVISAPYGTIVGGLNNGNSTQFGFFNFVGAGSNNTGTATAAVTTQAAATNGVTSGSTAVTLAASNASIKVGQLITGTGINSYTYVAAISGTSLTLSQNANATGTPTLSFYTPHGVVVGGGNNQATGSYSFIGGGGDAGTAANRNVASGDWSVVCGGINNTSSGLSSFIGGGGYYTGGSLYPNIASGVASSVVGGLKNTAGGAGTFIGGGFNNSTSGFYTQIAGGSFGTDRSIAGNAVFPACRQPISATLGISQSALLILARQTTDATPTVLSSDFNTAGTTNQVILPNNSAYYFKGRIIAGVTGAGNTSAWTFEGAIKRGANAGTTAIVGTVNTSLVAQDAGASTWTIAVAADTSNGGLKVTVTGQASTTIRWVCKVETTEMTY